MIEKSDILADLHSYVTPIGYSTINENVECLKNTNSKFIGVAGVYDGTGDKHSQDRLIRYIQNIRKVRLESEGLTAIPCLDVNLGQPVSIPDELLDLKLRYGVLSDMYWSVKHHTLQDLQSVIETEIRRKRINVVASPEKEIYYINGSNNGEGIYPSLRRYFEWLVDYTKKNEIYLEASEASARTNEGTRREILVYWLGLAKDNRNPIILGSNAFYCGNCGNFDYLLYILNKIEYPKELIINCNADYIERHLVVRDPMDIMEVDSQVGFNTPDEHKKKRVNALEKLRSGGKDGIVTRGIMRE